MDNKKVDYIVIGNGELDNNEDIEKTIKCPHCKKTHDIKYGDRILKNGSNIKSKLLAFYECHGKLYLAGVNGKKIK